jgi:hypothetical protein
MVIRRVIGKNGWVYEYDSPKGGANGKRRPYQHHLNFKYKETPAKSSKPVKDFPKIRRLCLIRDNYTCQICHKPSPPPYSDLNIHHKDGNGYYTNKHPNNDLSNLVILCDKCHMQLHFDVLEKQKSIVALRDEGFTLQAIGNKFGVSRQRIKQILDKGLDKP